MTLILDSTSPEKLQLLKEVALQMGVQVVQTSKKIPLKQTILKDKKTFAKQTIMQTEPPLSAVQKKIFANIKNSVKFIQEVKTGKKKGRPIQDLLDEL